ncbi:hypothetical protein NDU88_006589 [Pleurodeles waltl]|uniref:Uncharacterized protein n=1 Tax=Pleurodeles waltl TaxID=8319 RepID=A0AAV7VRT7_PLEWA|nr:hypothetical protein NDU88_006589 [Pleurodeles waltl]
MAAPGKSARGKPVFATGRPSAGHSSKKPVNQEELRRLMKEKQREKQRESVEKKRIESPFAKYPYSKVWLAYFMWRRAVELDHPRLLRRGPLVFASILDLLDSCMYVLKEKTKCSVLIAAVTAARADQPFFGIARAGEVLTRGCLSLFGDPFRVISARNAEHSEDGNGWQRC